MAYKTCEDCGSKMYNSGCSYCDEEIFIEQQYHELGEPTPYLIAAKADEQRYKNRLRED